jgi:hypothetical protein
LEKRPYLDKKNPSRARVDFPPDVLRIPFARTPGTAEFSR